MNKFARNAFYLAIPLAILNALVLNSILTPIDWGDTNGFGMLITWTMIIAYAALEIIGLLCFVILGYRIAKKREFTDKRFPALTLLLLLFPLCITAMIVLIGMLF